MFRRGHLTIAAAALSLTTGAVLAPAPAQAGAAPYTFAGPVFGLAATPADSLLVADSGAGVVELRKGKGELVVELPGVSDMDPIGRSSLYAITGGGEGPTAGKLFRASRGGTPTQVADLAAFEAAVNPDGGAVESNPFDVETLGGGRALVADAAGNSLLTVDSKGNVDWVATLPAEEVSTAHAKNLAGCPNPPPDLAFVCDLPPSMPAEGVPTSIAVGPDGAYYVGELKGFPGEPGTSRVWRIERGARHAECGTSPACRVVADGFTSIVDLTFGRHGKLYAVEIDEAGFLAAELGQTTGGTLNACRFGSWKCKPAATGLTVPIGAAVTKKGKVYVLVNALNPPEARVIRVH